jgi:hydrogenase expression/formation protein HypC
MCLGIPMHIREINGNVATAVLSGTTRRIYLDVLDEEAQVGDYVIVHAGFAIHRIDEKEAKETLNLFQEAGVFSSNSETNTDHGVH